MNVNELFDNVRVEMDDVNKNHYTDSMLLVPFNRIYTHVNFHIVMLGAEIGMKNATISTDGSNQGYDLPSDFLAFVEKHFFPHSPVTSATEYSRSDWIDQVAPSDPSIIISPASTRTNTPMSFYLEVSGQSQKVYFNELPPSGQYYDYFYWPKISLLTEAVIAATVMPYLGMLDPVFHYSLVTWCRDHREFTPALEREWLNAAYNNSDRILGLRHLQEREPEASIWEGYEW